MIGGGKGIPIFIFTAAIVMIGKTLTNAKSIVPKSSFFILLPPLLFSLMNDSWSFARLFAGSSVKLPGDIYA
jgi:hypothetical protein